MGKYDDFVDMFFFLFLQECLGLQFSKTHNLKS
jgi:hypothetical protein